MANGNFGGGDGTVGNPFLVEDAMDFMKLNSRLSSHFKQTKNIDMSSVSDFPPIGNASPFSGSYDGGGFNISNISILTADSNYQGVFSRLTGSLENMNVENVNVLTGGSTCTSAFIADATGAVVKNTRVTGSVKGRLRSSGFVSNAVGGVYHNCHADVAIVGGDGVNNATSGGFTAFATSGVSFSHCTAKGSVGFSGGNVGGFVGVSGDRTNLFKYCSSAVSISVSPTSYGTSNVGGFVGAANSGGNFLDCYSTGDIHAPMFTKVGGFIGDYANSTELHRCYSSGSPYASNYVGGFVGYLTLVAGNEGRVTGCFALCASVATSGVVQGANMGNFAGYSHSKVPMGIALDTMEFVVR